MSQARAGGNPPTFEGIVGFRRSVRKYLDRPVEPERWELLKSTALLAAGAFGLNSARLIFIIDPARRGPFVRAAFSGLMGKINPWLLVTKAPGFIALAGETGREVDELYLAEAAMLMEAVVLAAAEFGLGTCWIGGFGERKLSELLKLPENVRLVAISPVGYPPEAGGRLDWDTIARQVVSKRRMSLDHICRMADEEQISNAECGMRNADRFLGNDMTSVIDGLLESYRPADSFEPSSISKHTLMHLAEQARLAPSANNVQPWRFNIYVRPVNIAAAAAAASAVQLSGASALMAISAQEGLFKNRWKQQPFMMIDIPIACTHVLLAAQASGISSRILFKFDRVTVAKALSLERGLPLVALIFLGRAGSSLDRTAVDRDSLIRDESF